MGADVVNIRELLDALHRDTVKRWWHVSIGAGIALSLLTLGAWIDGANNDAFRSHDPETCAHNLGIDWDRVNGATEKLDAFAHCTGTDQWRCYVLTEGTDHIDVVRVAPNVTWPHAGRQVDCP